MSVEECSKTRIQSHVDLATPISLPRTVAHGLIVLMTIETFCFPTYYDGKQQERRRMEVYIDSAKQQCLPHKVCTKHFTQTYMYVNVYIFSSSFCSYNNNVHLLKCRMSSGTMAGRRDARNDRKWGYGSIFRRSGNGRCASVIPTMVCGVGEILFRLLPTLKSSFK